MNALHYITTYHHRNNVYARFLVSVPDGEGAREKAVEEVWPRGEPGWSQFTSQFVCLTNDVVHMEL